MKNALLCVFLLITQILFAQVQGPFSGASFTTVTITGSNKTWSSTSDAAPSDNIYTNFGDLTGGVGSFTDYLLATDFNFSVPSGAIISGIYVEVERSDPNRKTSDYSVRIVKGKGITGSEKASAGSYPASDSYQGYGGSGDLWGETWTVDDINDGGFGVAISAQRSEAGSTTDGMIDDVRITVYWSFSTLPVTLLNFNASYSGRSIDIRWTTTQELNMDHYEIQRSSNGRDFEMITRVNSRNQSTTALYSARDNNPLNGISYYRLKMVGVGGGDVTYSRIVSVQSTVGNSAVIYPSQWVKGERMYIVNPNRERLTIFFINQAGQLLGSTVTRNGDVNATTPSTQKGLIHYKVINDGGEKIGSGRILIK